jgi:adhesin transport system outer membrane protein
MLFADAKIKKAQSLPELYARAEHQRYPSGQNANRIFIGFQSNFGAGLSALDESNVLEQKALSSQAEEEARRLEVELQYETTLQEMSRALSSLPDIQANVQAAADSASSIKRQFLSGKRTWLDVLNAVREAMQARLDMIDAQMALVRSQWHLKLMAMPPQQAVEQFESTVR